MIKKHEVIFTPVQKSQSRFEYWVKFIKQHDCNQLAEVGVWKGEFAESILTNCNSIELYAMIDPWKNLNDWNKPFNVSENEFSDVYSEAMSRTNFAKEKIQIYRERTISAAIKIDDESFDLVYIDGDHTLRGITIDLINMLPKVKTGGFLCGDDFTHSPQQHSAEFEPTLIFPFAVYFAEAQGLPIYALGKNQFAIYNRPDLGYNFVDLTTSYPQVNLLSLYDKE